MTSPELQESEQKLIAYTKKWSNAMKILGGVFGGAWGIFFLAIFISEISPSYMLASAPLEEIPAAIPEPTWFQQYGIFVILGLIVLILSIIPFSIFMVKFKNKRNRGREAVAAIKKVIALVADLENVRSTKAVSVLNRMTYYSFLGAEVTIHNDPVSTPFPNFVVTRNDGSVQSVEVPGGSVIHSEYLLRLEK